MRVQIISDLHLEMNSCDIPVAGDIVVLAGDIHLGTDGIHWARERFPDCPVVYVAGNHEFYGRRVFPDLIDDLRSAAAESNVKFLENDEIIIGGIRFLGATLWTDCTLFGHARQDICMAAAKHGLNDFRGQIRRVTGELLRPQDVAETHRQSVAWLRESLNEQHTGPTIVVSHHAPCLMSADPYMRKDSLSPAFVNNLESMILDFQPAAWISGHTHYCCDYQIRDTRMISNQRGYHDSDVKDFRADLVVAFD